LSRPETTWKVIEEVRIREVTAPVFTLRRRAESLRILDCVLKPTNPLTWRSGARSTQIRRQPHEFRRESSGREMCVSLLCTNMHRATLEVVTKIGTYRQCLVKLQKPLIPLNSVRPLSGSLHVDSQTWRRQCSFAN
jgi:hypothetical protein